MIRQTYWKEPMMLPSQASAPGLTLSLSSQTPPLIEVNQDLRAGLENMTPLQRQRRAALLTDSPERSSPAKLSKKRHSPKSSTSSSSSSSESSSSSSPDSSSCSSDYSHRRSSLDGGCCCSKYFCCCCCCRMKRKGRSKHKYCSKSRSVFRRCIGRIGKSVVWKGILLGQLIALLLCTMSVLCTIIVENYSIKLTSGLSLGTYVIMGIVYTSLHCSGGNRESIWAIIRRRGIRYLFLSIVDVQSNYLINRSFQYTSLSSIQLLDCFSIPTVLILSWTILKSRYKLTHIAGLALGLMSVVTLVWVDIDDGRGGVTAGGKSRLLGDMLTLGGSFLSGISIVGLDHSIKSNEVYEFLGTKGIFGSLITAGQMTLLERSELKSIHWEIWEVGVLLSAYTIAQFAFYASMPFMLKVSSAAGLNLSLLSTDFYSIVAGVIFFNYNFNALYTLSILLVLLGLIVFNIEPVPSGALTCKGETSEKLKKASSSRRLSRTVDRVQYPSSGGTSVSSSMRTSQTSFNSCTILYPNKTRNSFVVASDPVSVQSPEASVQVHSMIGNGNHRPLICDEIM